MLLKKTSRLKKTLIIHQMPLAVYSQWHTYSKSDVCCLMSVNVRLLFDELFN